MGCDGGSIPTRAELVKEKKRDVIQDPKLELDAKWKSCRLTSDHLKEPVVACELGRLYNKTAVLEFLLNRADQPPARIELMSHVRKMADVSELQLTRSPDYVDAMDHGFSDRGNSAWCCPVTGVPMNGFNRFVFSRKTGRVVSEKALKEVPDACGDIDDSDDIIIINGAPEEVAELWVRMDTRRKAAKAARKAEKRAAKVMPPPDAAKVTANGGNGKVVAPPGVAKNVGTANAGKTAPRPTHGMTINMPVASDAMSKIKSIPTVTEDPRASKVLKSLFTSSAGKTGGVAYTSRGGARW